ncbi:MAG TPA: hypothetical protein VF463_05925 [Sphingobium sp.]
MATARHALQIACRFPAQILILKETTDQFDRSSGEAIAEALIDARQTTDFAAYCETVVMAPATPELSDRFGSHENYSEAYISGLVDEGLKLYRRFKREDEDLAPDEIAELKALAVVPAVMSAALQKRTFAMAADIAGRMIRGRAPDGAADPASFRDFVDSLAFRYGAMIVGLWIYRRGSPGPYPSNRRDVGADVMDLKIAAQASYFDGLLTHEKRLESLFGNGMSLIRALGGYCECGRKGGDGLIELEMPEARPAG